MILLEPRQAAMLRDWFLPDCPGPLIGLHVLATGHGACLVDRWPRPRAVLVQTAENFSLAGDPAALQPGTLQARVSGFVEASDAFIPLLSAAFSTARVWERVVFDQKRQPLRPAIAPGYRVRRLEPADAYHLWALGPDIAWIYKTWGGPAGLAASGSAWGAFRDGRLQSVACTFFVGERYEDVGVVTEQAARGRGLSAACASALCDDIRHRGRRPSWTTSPDNTASQRVADKLGFELERRDRLYIVGTG